SRRGHNQALVAQLGQFAVVRSCAPHLVFGIQHHHVIGVVRHVERLGRRPGQSLQNQRRRWPVLEGQIREIQLQPAFCPAGNGQWTRSEEHTSELQSRENLVCRLLLEKKK